MGIIVGARRGGRSQGKAEGNEKGWHPSCHRADSLTLLASVFSPGSRLARLILRSRPLAEAAPGPRAAALASPHGPEGTQGRAASATSCRLGRSICAPTVHGGLTRVSATTGSFLVREE